MWPEDQMEMIRDQAKGQNIGSGPRRCLFENPLKRFVVASIIKELHPTVRPVENMVDLLTTGCSFRTTHDKIPRRQGRFINDLVPVTFLFVPTMVFFLARDDLPAECPLLVRLAAECRA